MKEKPDYSVGFEPCPWCGEIPEIKKHFRDDDYYLRHVCKILCTIISIDWSDIERHRERWNQCKK